MPLVCGGVHRVYINTRSRLLSSQTTFFVPSEFEDMREWYGASGTRWSSTTDQRVPRGLRLLCQATADNGNFKCCGQRLLKEVFRGAPRCSAVLRGKGAGGFLLHQRRHGVGIGAPKSWGCPFKCLHGRGMGFELRGHGACVRVESSGEPGELRRKTAQVGDMFSIFSIFRHSFLAPPPSLVGIGSLVFSCIFFLVSR